MVVSSWFVQSKVGAMLVKEDELERIKQ